MITAFPVNLLLNGKKCLVVGGGKIALRKIRKLLDFDAEVVVVASEPSSRIKELAEKNVISLNERPFSDSDIDDICLVYAATDDHALNNKIIMLAEKAKILACSVDRGWREGSFITPASIRNKEITISVSSQGVACRKTKLIKENLARHIESIENTELIVIGTDQRLLPLKTRELLHLSGQRIDHAGEMIMNIWGVQGFVLLNTCNRIELIAAAGNSPALIDILKMILKFDSLKKEQYYIKTAYEAFKHLCFCVSGLYSQTPGENHITAQFKDACIYAQNKNWAGPVFDILQNNVLHVTKHIRNRTSDLFKGIEIEDIALKFMEAKMPDFRNSQISVIGTGALGKRIKEMLVEKKCGINWVYHSKCPACLEPGISIFSLDDLDRVLQETDILITALSFDKPAISGMRDKFFRPGAEVIDLGMPRNVSGDLAKLRKDVNFTNIEDLKHWHRRNNCDMAQVFAETEKIIDEHREVYEKFFKGFIDWNKGE
ncbi:MAG: hypothetical protein A2017_17805 [Lentisphaerae bacterium GWF2_44_16]|nr:MAG: hypothetical protein A2017_17805 [Lentisphaerae bacterium GWF2_44_16]